jgi:hypothetical protein
MTISPGSLGAHNRCFFASRTGLSSSAASWRRLAGPGR